jgi:CubicO group peptidase (beta-lactamase class C family)
VLLACFIFVQIPSFPQNMKAALQPFIDSGDIPGVVTVIANPEKVLSIESFGYQHIAKNKKMDGDVLFWIASQSKPIAGVAVMMLVDEGKLNLDEPVSVYLPELSNLMVFRVKREGWQVEERLSKPITLRHLLSHTSGMQWVANIQQQTGKIDVLPFSLSLYATAATPLIFEPGERYSYSNQGVNIAATVVERVSGLPYADFLQKRIFDPLGMKSATFWPTEKQIEKLAVPYKMDENGKLVETNIDQLQYPLSDKEKRFAEAAGGIFCTPSDLVKFYQMVANKGVFNEKRYLSEAAIAELEKKQTGEAIRDSYSLGWAVSDTHIGHGGAYGTDTKVYKKNGFVVMYFIQQQGLPKHDAAIQAFQKEVEKIVIP